MKDTVVIVRSNTPEDQREHFKERLKDRYGISISDDEYDNLCAPSKVFHGCFGKNRRKTVGWVTINNTKVWVLRDGELGRLATVYPPSVEHSDIEMIRSCFGGAAKWAALTIYKLYLEESKVVLKKKFDSTKDAALYFFSKTKFAPLHIDKYKHGNVRTVKVAGFIHNILNGRSEFVEICLKRKKTITKQEVQLRCIKPDAQ